MITAPMIFACLLHVMNVTQPVAYPTIKHSTYDLQRWGMWASTNAGTKVITVRDGLEENDLDRFDRHSIAHEFTRYILLKTEPGYTQGVWRDERVKTIERECYD